MLCLARAGLIPAATCLSCGQQSTGVGPAKVTLFWLDGGEEGMRRADVWSPRWACLGVLAKDTSPCLE